jgi:radical SAM-linked protein
MKPGTLPQRLRVTFIKDEEVKYISHLDLMRLWERALRRAEVPLLHSQGFNPRPKISFAAPLAVGITGQREILDVTLERPLATKDFARAVNAQLPSGVTLVEVQEVYTTLPPLQTQVQGAEYLASVALGEDRRQLEGRIASLLGSAQLPRLRRGREYDLRPLIEELRLEREQEDHYVLSMRLRAGEQGTGRPDEVLDELGVADQVQSTTRTRLLFSPAGEE